MQEKHLCLAFWCYIESYEKAPESAEIAQSWSQIRFRLFASFFFNAVCHGILRAEKRRQTSSSSCFPARAGGRISTVHISYIRKNKIAERICLGQRRISQKKPTLQLDSRLVHELSAFSFFPPLLVILVVESRPAPTSLSGSVSSGTGAEELLENYQRGDLH